MTISPDMFYGARSSNLAAAATRTPESQRFMSRLPSSTSPHVPKAAIYLAASNEMSGKFAGPIDPGNFLDNHLPLNRLGDDDRGNMSEFRAAFVAALEQCKVAKSETKLYDPLIAALSPYCPDLKIVNTSNSVDKDSGYFLGHAIKPDIAFYRSSMNISNDKPTRVRLMESILEIKMDSSCQPFDDQAKSHKEFETTTEAGQETRGQLIIYANALLASQLRTHAFTIFINGSFCRIIHWTRSCATVTREFDLDSIEGSSWLLDFLWRFSRATPEYRGHDKSFVPISDSVSPTDAYEAKLAREALNATSEEPLYKVGVKDEFSGETSYYIIRGVPVTQTHYFPVGRGTRGFIAYNCQFDAEATSPMEREKTGSELVFLKDTWRIDGYDTEGEVYLRLQKSQVRNIAPRLTSGDVSVTVQEAKFHKCGPPNGRKVQARVHYHYRLVLDRIGKPLSEFSYSWEMVTAVLHALQAHLDAYIKAGLLHRDISIDNIMVYWKDGKVTGFLVDWACEEARRASVRVGY
ncbi:other/FunK1 protein kinase [Coprinopsis cinerea AmutBmut pab1-1]|nr:other/FunK1 protein kinase [Coprinopsis cinerea AmutBmut pab1-1]